MSVMGVIAEFNPFHAGHLRLLREGVRRSGCEHAVAVMAGSFSQRGEPMLYDKWTRARMALEAGFSLVVELPTLFAVREAEGFARGGVRLLSALGADTLCFGCETDDENALFRMADALREEPEPLKTRLREGLRAGKSYARARGEALCAYLGLPDAYANRPNLTLALEYLRENERLAAPMRALVVPREGAYHDQTLSGMASASAIRAALADGREAEALAALPDFSANIARERAGARAEGAAFDRLALYAVRARSLAQLEALPGADEGLANRVYRLAREVGGREELLARLKCKRYTYARLSRFVAHAALGVTREARENCALPEYARVLGVRECAKPLLAQAAKTSPIPVLASAKPLRAYPSFRFDEAATELRALCAASSAERRAEADYRTRIVTL